jgi:ankyrin repeat protein
MTTDLRATLLEIESGVSKATENMIADTENRIKTLADALCHRLVSELGLRLREIQIESQIADNEKSLEDLIVPECLAHRSITSILRHKHKNLLDWETESFDRIGSSRESSSSQEHQQRTSPGTPFSQGYPKTRLEEDLARNYEPKYNASQYEFSQLPVVAGAQSSNQETRTVRRSTGPIVATDCRGSAELQLVQPQCNNGCSCNCHRQGIDREWTFNAFRLLIGTLRVLYRWPRQGNPQCGDNQCRIRYREACIQIDYNFPNWLLPIILTFILWSSPTRPELLLRVCRRIPFNSTYLAGSIFSYIYKKDIEGAKRALRRKQCSLYDIMEDGDEWCNVLREAVSYRFTAMVKLLVDEGIDPLPISQNDSIQSMALFSSLCSFKQKNWFMKVIPFSSFMKYADEEMGFTDLHKIILGILPLDLRQSLCNPYLQAQINNPGSKGITPLTLASMRGDTLAIQLLIENGANINGQSEVRGSPLKNACRYGNVDAVRLLLDAGAEVNKFHPMSASPLHFAALTADTFGDMATIQLLIERGADVNIQDSYQAGPLLSAIQTDNSEAAKLLIEHGALVDHRDWEQDTVIISAIIVRASRSVKVLLEAGADYTIINKYGRGVLHTIALYADMEIMQLFASIKMCGLNKNARDTSGKTPWQLFHDRQDVPPELQIEFWRLMDSVREINKSDEQIGNNDAMSEVSDEEFFDSLESYQLIPATA